jgi:hypothetical protein
MRLVGRRGVVGIVLGMSRMGEGRAVRRRSRRWVLKRGHKGYCLWRRRLVKQSMALP